MKTLIDGTQVNSRSYYFLLDWNEVDGRNIMIEKFNKYKLCELTSEEYQILWLHATTFDLTNNFK